MRAIRWLLPIGAALAGVAGAWTLSQGSVEAGEPTVEAARPGAVRRAVVRGERPVRPAAHRPERPPPKLTPEERAEVRELTRADQTDALLAEIEAHALENGWDDASIAAVQDEFATTTEAISLELARVDRGEVRWDEVKAPVRQLRLDSAARVEALLGTARFRALVADVGLERFHGDTPVRGRLEGGRADARAAR